MFNDLLYRLRTVFRRTTVEQELDQELRFHLEEETEKFIRAGVSPEEASRLARLALQGPEQAKERVRDVRGTLLWDSTVQDLRYAVRQIKGAPAFAAVAVAILALGIGVNTAIFSLLDSVMLRSLPVRDPQQLIVPRWTAKDTPHPYDEDDYDTCVDSRVKSAAGGCAFPYPIFKLMEADRDLFSDSAAFAGPMSLNENGQGSAAVIDGLIVSGDFFQTLGVRPILGRTFNQSDDTPGANATVVLSYAYWKGAFGGDAAIIGKIIRLNAMPVTIIGVAEPRFNRWSPGRSCNVWIPLHPAVALGLMDLATPLHDEHHFWLRIIQRMKPGVTAARAESALTSVFRQEMLNQSKVLKPDSAAAIEVVSANKALAGFREMLERPIYVLMCAVGLILLIACSNVAGLMIARAAARQREFAIRLAVGAARVRIVRQLLTESLVIAALGGLGGLVLAQAGTRLLTSFLWVRLDVKPDIRMLLFTTTTSIACGLFFGIIPALHSTRVRSAPSADFDGLQQSMTPFASRRWFRNVLVVAQVALALVLLVGAGLFLRTLQNLSRINPGFNSGRLLLFQVDPVSLHYKEPQIQTLYRSLRERLAEVPGVRGVTYSRSALLGGSLSSSDYQIEGRSDHAEQKVYLMDVGPDFFQTMDIPVLKGRVFSAEEFTHSRKVALVNQAFVREYLPGRDPLGLHFGEGSSDGPYQIIGVSGDTKYNNLRAKIGPTAYLPLKSSGAHFELRTQGDPAAIVPAVRQIVRATDANLPITEVKTQTEQIEESLMIERLVADLSAAFALLALTLACVGLYGLLSYEVARRTREIGIRMAVGADPRKVRAGILRETLGIVAVGLVVGLPVALAATHAVAAMLYEIRADDPLTLIIITTALILVSGIAGYIPARKASLVDPMSALRAE